MKRILKVTGLLFCLFLTLRTYAQDVTIDYQAWNPSSPPCNLFASPTDVPATIDGSSGTIQHQTKIGQPEYSKLILKLAELIRQLPNILLLECHLLLQA